MFSDVNVNQKIKLDFFEAPHGDNLFVDDINRNLKIDEDIVEKVEYLDLCKTSSDLVLNLNNKSYTYSEIIDNYTVIRDTVGGCKTESSGVNDFYIRFGEPSTAGGKAAINCFVAGTMIKTDQGELPIEKVSRKNTINGDKVYCIETSLLKNKDDFYLLVKKDAFGENRPDKDTLSTKWHGVYIKEQDTEFIRLIDLIDEKNIIKKPVVEPVKFYNICLKDKHGYMYANNLKVETLDPEDHLLPIYG